MADGKKQHYDRCQSLTRSKEISHFSIASCERIEDPSTTGKISRMKLVVWIGK